ncbi:MAG: methylmalonyl-CoA epimerase [Candidatus Aminicenantes bacterium]|nr:methylmalonyl-CoA epimerase [Candidatus Aminicenantes bacterium]
MGIKRIDHLGIAVKDLEASLKKWQELFAAKVGAIEEIRERGVKVAPLEFEDGSVVELVAPLGEDSPLEKFINERGEGIHHLSLEVDGIEEVMERLKNKGIRFIQEEPQKGAEGSKIAFVHPRNLGGVLLELKEKQK